MSDLFTQNSLSRELVAFQETLTALAPVVNQGLLTRQQLAGLGSTFDGNRDMYKLLGYPSTIPKNGFYHKYTRQGISKRIIDAYPNAIWSDKPNLVEDDESEQLTEFEKAAVDLHKHTGLYSVLNRFDKAIRMGEYGVLMIGTNKNGGDDFSEPLESIRSLEDIVYLRPFSQQNAQITRWVTDIHDPHYGQPEIYTLHLGNYGGRNAGSTMPGRTIEVHRSRVIHAAEDMLENQVFGIPSLMPVYNRLIDYEKVVGGSSEMFWLNGRGGLSAEVEAPKENVMPVEIDTIKTAIENYLNSMTRAIGMQGATLKPIQFNVADPKSHFEMLVADISGTTGIPQRILLGSERGELASTQDQNNWNSRIKERRENFCEDSILRPLVNRFIEIGALPMIDEFEVQWPELNELSETDKSEIASKKAKAIADYANSDLARYVVPEEQFVENVLQMDYKGTSIEDELDKERDEDEAGLPDDNPDDDNDNPAEGSN